MKKINLEVIVILLIGFLLINFLKPNQWNIMIYSLLFCISFYSFLQKIFIIYKTRKGTYTDGYIIEKQGISKLENDVTKSTIEFVSPADNERYQISVLEESILESEIIGDKIKIWVNLKNPTKSLVVKKLNSLSILSLVSVFIFSIAFLALIVYSWN
jgi:hypothetical protein